MVLYDIQDIFLERSSVLHFVEKTVPCQLSDSGHDRGQYGHPGLFLGRLVRGTRGVKFLHQLFAKDDRLCGQCQ